MPRPSPLLTLLLALSPGLALLACTDPPPENKVQVPDIIDDCPGAGKDMGQAHSDANNLTDLDPDDLDETDETDETDLDPGDTGPPPRHGLTARPPNETCFAPPRPPASAGVKLTPAFDNLRFASPVAMLQAPGDDARWYVLEQAGRVVFFDNLSEAAQSEVFVDIVGDIPFAGERGLLGMAFHPRFQSNRQVFLSYSIWVPAERTLYTRITRVLMHEERHALDMSTEERIFQVAQPFGNHNGGSIAFGPDGYLHAGYGDGGDGGDPLGNGQNLQTHLGTMIRIDVDRPDPERLTAYSVPADNPFVGRPDALPEIWAYGLRNPWKFSFDLADGTLWAGDVGQRRVEEIDIIIKGGNYGWNVFEGSECYLDNPACASLDAIGPVLEYPHTSRASVTGGFVYRGSLMPALRGAYLYADYSSGRVWAAMPDEDAQTGYRAEILFESAGFSISSFGQDHDGEVYLIRYDDEEGRLYRLEPEAVGLPSDFPVLLSQTGCVDPARPWEPAPGLIPYELNVPFWSDGASKERWMAIPDQKRICVLEDGDLKLPIGSVTLKHFRLDGRLIETRLMVRHDDGDWAGYTYRWDEEQREATLLDQDARRVVGDQVWRYPSRAACIECHNDTAGGTLGLELAQLDREATYFNGQTGDQLATLRHIGLLEGEASPRAWAALRPTASEAPLEERARAYLHANCAYCHRPGGPGQSDLDLRAQTPWPLVQACNASPQEGDLGLEGALLLRPGDPANSLLWERMRRLDESRMPSTLSTVLDEEGLALIEDWILTLDGCDP